MTVIEILVAMSIFGIVMGGIFSFFSSEQRAYRRQYRAQERDQALRFAVNTLVQELMEAGYRAAGDDLTRDLSVWIPADFAISTPMRVHFDANPKMTLGDGNSPDMITFLTVLPTDTGSTLLSAPTDGTLITLGMAKSKVRDQFKPGDLICFGAEETHARVAEVSGNTLTIDTDPLTPGNQPPLHSYPAGTDVGEISVVTYAVFNELNDPTHRSHTAGYPELKRRVNAGTFQPVAENISDLQVSIEPDGRIKVALSALLDPPAAGRDDDGDRGLRTAVTIIRLRNASRPGAGLDCEIPAAPGNVVVRGALNADYPCRIAITWDPVVDSDEGGLLPEKDCAVTGYRLFFDVIAGAFGHDIDLAIGAEEGYELDVRRMPSDVYYVSVAAINGGGIGKRSVEIAVRDQVAPSRPFGLVATLNAAGAVVLTWEEPTDCDLSGYWVVRRSGAGAPFLTISAGPIPVGAPRFLDENPPPGVICEYGVRSEDNGFNVSPLSETRSVSIPGVSVSEVK